VEEHIKNTQYEILTPSGWKDFSGMRKLSKSEYATISTETTELKCSLNHKVKTTDGWKKSKELLCGDRIVGVEKSSTISSVGIVEDEIDLFDILEVENHEYYSNGLVSHNCDFVGSVNTLIEAKKLKELTYKEYVFRNDEGFDVLVEPEEDHTYVMCVDVSRGQGLDYHAFTIVDITEMPYRVVAKFRNNQMSPLVYPNAIYSAAMQYNKAHILVELNDIGGQVADILHHEMEYDHLLVTTVRGRKGQTLDGGFGSGQSQYGIRTTEAVKRVGCSLLKSMIEENKLIVEDFDIIKEFVSFISKKKTYQAETGHHDDLVMTLVLFGWLTTQTYFKELTNLDIRKDLYEDKMKQIEDDMTPFGFIEDGINSQENTYIDGDGDVWGIGGKDSDWIM